MKTTLLTLVVLLALSSCKKEEEPNVAKDIKSPPIQFVLLDKYAIPLITSTNTSLRISSTNLAGNYFELGPECQGCESIGAFAPSSYRPYDFFYGSGTLADNSSQGVKQWLLTLNGKTDTLFYDVQPPSGNLSYRVVGASFNGVPVQLDQRLMPPAYVLQRRH